MATSPLYTLVLHNGVTVQFYTGNLELDIDKTTGRVKKIKAASKRRSLSLLFAKPDEIDCIVRDTSDSEQDQDHELGSEGPDFTEGPQRYGTGDGRGVE